MGVLLCFHTSESFAATPPAWQVEFCLRLHEMRAGEFLDTALAGFLELQAVALDNRPAIPAIFEMFVRGEHEIKIFWWKHENRAVRCFVMALYLCATAEGPSWLPEFELYFSRFNEQEKLERREEQAFILEYRSSLAGVIAEILQQRDMEQYTSKYEPYFGNMAKAGFGKRLPRWCEHAEE